MAQPTMTLERFPDALDSATAMISSYPTSEWDAPTPCAGWTAAHLVGHLIWGQRSLRRMAEGDDAYTSMPDMDQLREQAGDDPLAAWRQSRRVALEAFTEETLGRPVKVPIGEMPLGVFADTFASLDLLVHTWDLATACDRRLELDPRLVHELFGIVQAAPEALRQPFLFGPEVPAPPGAGEQDRFLAFLGREVPA